MTWLRIRLTEEQQRVVNEERSVHPNPRIREKMLVLWLLHNEVTVSYTHLTLPTILAACCRVTPLCNNQITSIFSRIRGLG